MEDKGDHNFVADAQNYEQRVKAELEGAKQWYGDWGSLYCPDAPTSYDERIKMLQDKARKIPGVRLETNNSSYGTGKPYREFAKIKVKKPDVI